MGILLFLHAQFNISLSGRALGNILFVFNNEISSSVSNKYIILHNSSIFCIVKFVPNFLFIAGNIITEVILFNLSQSGVIGPGGVGGVGGVGGPKGPVSPGGNIGPIGPMGIFLSKFLNILININIFF